jgi:hypothetical protein
MSHSASAETEAVNPDSFLDIVASVVSIMIIMVLMTGLKIKHTPVEPPTAGLKAAQAEFRQALAAEEAMRGDVLGVAAEIEHIKREMAVHRLERDALATAVALEERKTAATKEKTSAIASQRNEAAARGVTEARSRLDDLRAQREALASAGPPPLVVENYPTPLSRTVDGEEIHFQLRGKRLALLPWQKLMDLAVHDARGRLSGVREGGKLSGMVGPLDGFRLRYALDFVEGLHHNPDALVEFRPVAENMGETLAEALAPGSQFLLAITPRRINRNTLCVTIWTYPDSFDVFRQLKKELYRMGFSVAARPLEMDQWITGSSKGTKSSAE